MSRKSLIFIFFYLQSVTSVFAATLSVLSDGSDGLFAPTVSTTLSLDSGVTFNFSGIQIGSGLTVDFNQNGLAVNFLGTNDVFINGILDASFLDLTITTPGQLIIGGELFAKSLKLDAANISIAGILNAQGNISLLARNSISVDQYAEISSNGATLTASDISIINQPSNGEVMLIDGSGVVLFPSSPITLVPVPASVWLFGSGLLGLAGTFRCNKSG